MEKQKYIQTGNALREVLSQLIPTHMFPEKFYKKNPINLDLSINNKALSNLNNEPRSFLSNYINNTLKEENNIWAIGGYGEKRNLYQASENFSNGEEERNIHLGTDIWLPAGTSIFAPISGTVHSFQDNNKFLDYGPTIILEHQVQNITFFTLYGHLSRTSLIPLHEGQQISAGEQIASIGEENENGSWPTHLHFQIICDMFGTKGDYPGVASQKDSEFYLSICPNPNFLLGLN